MQAKILIALLSLAVAFVGGWNIGSDRVQHKWDKERLETAEAARVAAGKNAKIINDLEAEKNESNKTIDRLRDDIAGFRVRVPKTPCVRSDPSGRGGDATSTDGKPADQSQEAFDRFRHSLESDAANADKVIENCRVVVDWAKGLVTK